MSIEIMHRTSAHLVHCRTESTRPLQVSLRRPKTSSNKEALATLFQSVSCLDHSCPKTMDINIQHTRATRGHAPDRVSLHSTDSKAVTPRHIAVKSIDNKVRRGLRRRWRPYVLFSGIAGYGGFLLPSPEFASWDGQNHLSYIMELKFPGLLLRV